ncbi:uncharacterized protein LOC131615246 [Vicia villosa]|uniref:uncharacterized protein LOC131615246 n=1 Tax=Vicia villosa TaxID=3911 RepID=UPI00273C83E0|nr:uncharacterized protein LOC131615246 [Vicia villosa]
MHINTSQYRPICLVGCMYKAISKLLVGRLKKVLHAIISPSQNAFVSGRQLLDGVVVANEVVDLVKIEGRRSILFNVDFEKAYDKVSWNFLRYIMDRMGFGVLWRTWVDILVFHSKMFVLVNGCPTKELVGLAGLVRKSVENSEFKGLDIKGECEVDILQFADDTLLVGEGSYRHVLAIKEVLSCKVEEGMFTFIGIVIGCNPRKVATWKPPEALWLETVCLKKDFPELYEKSSLKKVAVAGMGGGGGGYGRLGEWGMDLGELWD